MNENEELGKNIKRLLALLKKILSDSKNVQLNLCMLAFMPFQPEDFEDLEDTFDSVMDGDKEMAERESLAFEITSDDKDFLKKYGIKF